MATATTAAPVTANLDKFGYKKGTKKAIFNAALTTKPRTMKEIMEKAELPFPMPHHVAEMVKKGFAVKTPEGYALAGEKELKKALKAAPAAPAPKAAKKAAAPKAAKKTAKKKTAVKAEPAGIF